MSFTRSPRYLKLLFSSSSADIRAPATLPVGSGSVVGLARLPLQFDGLRARILPVTTGYVMKGPAVVEFPEGNFEAFTGAFSLLPGNGPGVAEPLQARPSPVFEFATTLTFRTLHRNHIVSAEFETIEKDKEGSLSTCDEQFIMKCQEHNRSWIRSVSSVASTRWL